MAVSIRSLVLVASTLGTWGWADAPMMPAEEASPKPAQEARQAAAPAADRSGELPTADGYRGIWYANQPSRDQYKYKYSGGLGTYPQQHIPIAYYSAQARKTFFVYGGTAPDANRLWHMVSYYDHATGTVPPPRILLDKKTDDAHDNPTIMLDDAGHIWVFSNAHGTGRPAFIHRSRQPYSIAAFDRVLTTNFSYSQPWHLPGLGFCFLHTRYSKQGQRFLYVWSSRDGMHWEEPLPLARVPGGHYQISARDGTRIGTALNYHPPKLGVNGRTNLYYLETRDGGKTWSAADGRPLALPLVEVRNPALVHDYESEKRLVYLKDIGFDGQRRPVILFLTSGHYASGPTGDPRIWHTARWTGQKWLIQEVCRSDHNYDFGSLYLESDGTWRLIAPTEPGPQPYNPGGEVAVWISRDQGATWTKLKQLTQQSQYNHTYVRRPVHAHPEFYALWADGDTRKPSASRLYFTDRDGTHVWQLPDRMEGDSAKPVVVR